MELSNEDIGKRFRHKRTGNDYLLVGFGVLEKDDSLQAIYRLRCSPGAPIFWVRPVKEFIQKFEPVAKEIYELTEQMLKAEG